jgi:hypothetical protein
MFSECLSSIIINSLGHLHVCQCVGKTLYVKNHVYTFKRNNCLHVLKVRFFDRFIDLVRCLLGAVVRAEAQRSGDPYVPGSNPTVGHGCQPFG